MRAIKFRAWDSEKNKMAREVPFMITTGFASNALFEIEYDGRLNWMQFTGLHDKNGKEIYEGDVVQAARFNPTRQVIYDGAGFRPFVEEYMDDAFQSEKCEVIGNIYENPELLSDKVK